MVYVVYQSLCCEIVLIWCHWGCDTETDECLTQESWRSCYITEGRFSRSKPLELPLTHHIKACVSFTGTRVTIQLELCVSEWACITIQIELCVSEWVLVWVCLCSLVFSCVLCVCELVEGGMNGYLRWSLRSGWVACVCVCVCVLIGMPVLISMCLYLHVSERELRTGIPVFPMYMYMYYKED